VAIVVGALGLGFVDFGEFGEGVDGLIAAWAEEDIGDGEVFDEEPESDGGTGLEGEEASGGAGGGVEAGGAGEGRGFGAVGNFPIVIGGVGTDPGADLAEIGKAGGAASGVEESTGDWEEKSDEDRDDGDDDEELDEGEGTGAGPFW